MLSGLLVRLVELNYSADSRIADAEHLRGLSNDGVVNLWYYESAYVQNICGEEYFQAQMPIHASSLVQFRRIGKSGCELIVKAKVVSSLRSGRYLQQVTVDTAVQEWAVTVSNGYEIATGGRRCRMNARLKRLLKRLQAVELVIGRMKNDDLLDRNYLQGIKGSQMNVMLNCVDHNL